MPQTADAMLQPLKQPCGKANMAHVYMLNLQYADEQTGARLMFGRAGVL